ncbi:MAG TPA: glycerol-3-phosphate 1-O-acyltransferase PlsY [Chloroflexia bacterium]|nr:glycerol-3-phosphate 1-O-acyltransferase PlsY [Chloroflexia bacterium]
MNWLALAIFVLVAYLVSAFPSGVVWGRLLKGIDIRSYGSGKTGATNSLRTLGWQVSLLVFASDMGKGALSVGLPLLLGSLFFKEHGQDNTPWAVMACGMASVIGHNHSVYIGFKGGRGVAAGIGQVLVVSPLTILMVGLVDIWVIVFTRYISLASLVGCVLVNIFLVANIWLTNLDPRYLVWGGLVTGYVFISHRDNIERLMNGTERKLGEKAKPVTSAEPKGRVTGAAKRPENLGSKH